MQKKKLVGLIGLALVVLMTVFAYFLPGEAAAETHTDVIRIRVYDQYPGITITKPENESVTTSSSGEISFDYENSSEVKMTLTHEDSEGNVSTTELPKYVPEVMDEDFPYSSGSATVPFDLADYNLDYGRFILALDSTSEVGDDSQSVEFYYLPATATQVGSSDENNDPIVRVDYDSNVAKVEVMPVDKNGKPLFDEPIVVEIPSPYETGSKEITLPFGSYGLASGDYTLQITSYTANADTGALEKIVLPADVPANLFKVSYTQPDAPAIPNTGHLFKNLGVSSSDLVITSVLVFSFVAILAFILLGHKKKDYRKNLRSRK